MNMTTKGYYAPGYLTSYVKTLPLFHDPSQQHFKPNSARKHYPGMCPPLITPVTEYGERVISRN